MQPRLVLEIGDATCDGESNLIHFKATYINDGREQSGAIKERLSTRDYDDLRWYAEDFSRLPEGGNVIRAEAVSNRFTNWGLQAFSQLTGTAVNEWLREVTASNCGKLEIAPKDPSISVCMAAPWELLRVPDGRFLHELNVAVVRRTTRFYNSSYADQRAELRALSVVCRPKQTSFLDPRYTAGALLEIAARQRGLVIDFCRPPTLKAVERMLRKSIQSGSPYSVLHFDGHGTMLAEPNSAALCFENLDGDLDLVRAEQLSSALGSFGLTLVVLEACRSAAAWSGSNTVADALLRGGVAAVLGMSYAVSIDSTRDFLSAMFRSLADGQDIGYAVTKARNDGSVRSGGRLHPTLFVPQLYEGRPGAVFRPAAQIPSSEGVINPQPLSGHTEQPLFGRGWDLHGLERLITPFRAIAVTGIIGSGKTSLVNEMKMWWIRNGMFPDGAIHLTLNSGSTPLTVAQEVQGLLFGTASAGGNPVQRVAQALASRQTLIILDDYDRCLPASDYPHVRFSDFMDLARSWTSGKTRIVVCSRKPATDVIEETPNWGVYGLPIEEGIKLLRNTWLAALPAGRELRDSNDELAHIVRLVAGHPAALKVIGAILGGSGAVASPYDVASLIEGDKGRWRFPLTEAIKHLSTEARRILPFYALLSPVATDQVFLDMLGIPAADLQKPVAELRRFGLITIEETTHHIHPLLPYILESSADTEIATRFVESLTALCRGLSQAFQSGNSASAVTVVSKMEVAIRRALDIVCKSGRENDAREILNPLLYFLERSQRVGDKAKLIERSNGLLADATSSHRNHSLATSSFALLRSANELLGRTDLKPEALLQALGELVDEADSHDDAQRRLDQARVIFDMAKISTDRTGNHEMALDLVNRAERICSIYEKEWDSANLSNIRSGLLGVRAIALRHLGRFEEAMSVAESALKVSTSAGDQTLIARSYARIGYVAQPAGRLDVAKDAYEKAIAIASKTSDYVSLAHAYKGMGEVFIATRNFEPAENYLISALNAYRTARDRKQEVAVIASLSTLELARNNWDAVLGWCDLLEQGPDSADLPEVIAASLLNRSAALSELARIHPEKGSQLRNDAVRAAKEALSLFRTGSSAPSMVIALLRYADVLRRNEQWEPAELHAREAQRLQQILRIPLSQDTEILLEEIMHRRKLPVRGQPDGLVREVLRMALDCRLLVSHGEPSTRILGSFSPGFLESLKQAAEWLHANFLALAFVSDRPCDFVPRENRAAIESAWREADGDQSGPI